MRYMLMLYANEKAGVAIPPEQMAKAMETMYAYQAALTKAGAFVRDGDRIKPVPASTETVSN